MCVKVTAQEPQTNKDTTLAKIEQKRTLLGPPVHNRSKVEIYA